MARSTCPLGHRTRIEPRAPACPADASPAALPACAGALATRRPAGDGAEETDEPTPGGYAFDLVDAVVGACCHGNDILRLLVRRVAVDD